MPVFLSDSALLDVFETGFAQSPLDRALTMLALADDQRAPHDRAMLSIGERDRSLMNVRQSLFGSRVVGLAQCPHCEERVELDFDLEDIRNASAAPPEDLTLSSGGYEVTFRLPRSRDVADAIGENDRVLIKQRLLERCVVHAVQSGEAVSFSELPETLKQLLVEKMSAADPQGNLQLACACVACGKSWLSTFDITSFLWNEIRAAASRVLQEVHGLASAYGWREADILNMSSQRRQLYLHVIHG